MCYNEVLQTLLEAVVCLVPYRSPYNGSADENIISRMAEMSPISDSDFNCEVVSSVSIYPHFYGDLFVTHHTATAKYSQR